MNFQFSQQLVERIQAYFKRVYDLDISDETAQEYLKSYAEMFAVFAEIDFIEYQDVDESKPDLYCQECLLSLINASEEVEKKIKLKS